MKHYLLEGIIDERCLRDFIAFCNQYDEEQKVVFLDSDGGYRAYAIAISAVINQTPGMFTLIAINSIRSCAVELFFRCFCERIVQPGSTAMIHTTGREVRVLHDGIIPSETEKFELDQLRLSMEEQAEFWKEWGLTAPELEAFKAGKDVLIGYSRLNLMSNWYKGAV